MSTTPDVRMFGWLHGAMRATGDELVAAVAGLALGDRPRAQALAAWFAGFTHELVSHHEIEDDIFFPALADRVADFDDHDRHLRADHGRLDEVLAGLGRSLAALAGPAPTADEHATAVVQAGELRDLLHRHLDLEDQEVVPLFVRHFSGEEFERMNDAALKSNRLGALRFTAPWLVAHLTVEERNALFDSVPGALKLLWRASRRRYERRTRRAFGAFPVPAPVPVA